MMKKCLLAVFVVAILVLPVSAEMLFNGSFEDVIGSDGVPGDGWTAYAAGGWVGFAQAGTPAHAPIGAVDGTTHLYAGGSGGGGGGAYQAVPLGAGNTYTVSCWGVSQPGWGDDADIYTQFRAELHYYGDFNGDGVLDMDNLHPGDHQVEIITLYEGAGYYPYSWADPDPLLPFTQFSATSAPAPNETQYGQIDFTQYGGAGKAAGWGMDVASLTPLVTKSATEPVPSHGATEVPLTLTHLTWDNPTVAASNFKLEVQVGDPNWAAGGIYTTASVVDTDSDPLTTTAALPAGLTLDYDTTYNWRVTSTSSGTDWVGPNWTFDAEDSLKVDSGLSSLTWLDPTLASVDLTGSVTVAPGSGNSVTSILWTVAINPVTLLPDKPAGSTVTIASPTSAVTTATMDTQGIYYLQLAGEDSAGLEKIELLKVTVASDACAAAKETENPPMNYVAPIHDSNDDCIVNLTDFASFAAEWVDNKALTVNYEYEW